MAESTKTPIQFYFDFSSPYGYLASCRIDGIASRHGRSVDWRPMLLGAVFKLNGQQPLLGIPLKGDYAKHDMARSARYLDVPYKGLPDPFPFASVAAARAYYWLLDRDAEKARALAKALYAAAFAEQRDISKPDTVVAVAVEQGHDAAAVTAALQDPAVKERLKQEVDGAVAAQVFGSPFIVIDGEAFWGADRLDQVERWLETGGW